MKKMKYAILCTLLIMNMTACSSTEASPSYEETGITESTEASPSYEETGITESSEYEMEIWNEDNNTIETVDEFFSDTPMEQWNVKGNNFANLSDFSTPSGRITAQGDWIYFYSMGAIYKKQGDNAVEYIIDADDAYSLNIVGDWIYYKEGQQIYKVRTDGEDKEILFENVSSNIFVVDNKICFCSLQNKSATIYDYCINVADLNSKDILQQYNVGEVNIILIGFFPETGKAYFYVPGYLADRTFGVFEVDYYTNTCNKILSIALDGYEWSLDDKLFAAMNDSLIIANAFHENDYNPGENVIQIYDLSSGTVINEIRRNWYRKMVTANISNDHIICNPDTNSYKLYYIGSSELNEEFASNNAPFLEETTVYTEIYSIGEYVYYCIANTGDYFNRPIYRIKIDGTSWSLVK